MKRQGIKIALKIAYESDSTVNEKENEENVHLGANVLIFHDVSESIFLN